MKRALDELKVAQADDCERLADMRSIARSESGRDVAYAGNTQHCGAFGFVVGAECGNREWHASSDSDQASVWRHPDIFCGTLVSFSDFAAEAMCQTHSRLVSRAREEKKKETSPPREIFL